MAPLYIDADTHVDECDETWEYLNPDERYLAPRTIAFERDEVPPWIGPLGSVRSTMGTGYESGYYRYWFIDGQLFVRRIRSDERTGTSKETRELTNIPQRIRDMDGMDVATQVIYPTLFLSEVTRRCEIELALYRAYNRWLADRCSDSSDRLRWIAMIPFGSMPDALAEIQFAKEHGAVGVFKRGIECGERSASDPHFFPAYRAAEEAGLPICFHQASSWKPVEGFLSVVRPPVEFPLLSAFSSLMANKVPQLFPNLRFGFIEAGSSWVPYVLENNGVHGREQGLEDLNFFVTCELREDLGYLLGLLGNERFFIGTDYSHADRAAVNDAHKRIHERADLSAESMRRITADNAKTFYSL